MSGGAFLALVVGTPNARLTRREVFSPHSLCPCPLGLSEGSRPASG